MNRNTGKRKGILIYYSMLPIFRQLENWELGKLIMAIMEYSSEGTLPEPISPRADILFSIMKQSDDADAERFAAVFEARRAAGIRSGEVRRGEISHAV